MPFTFTEQREMVIYVLLRIGDYKVAGNELWKQAVREGVCQHPRINEKMRSWEAMRDRFTKYMLRREEILNLSLHTSINNFFVERGGVEPRDVEEKREFRKARFDLVEEYFEELPEPVQRLWRNERGSVEPPQVLVQRRPRIASPPQETLREEPAREGVRRTRRLCPRRQAIFDKSASESGSVREEPVREGERRTRPLGPGRTGIYDESASESEDERTLEAAAPVYPVFRNSNCPQASHNKENQVEIISLVVQKLHPPISADA